MSNWDLMMPGMGLTAIGLAGVTISYAGIAHTFVDGMHALTGLTMFIGMIFLAAGILDGGVSTSNRAKATTLVVLGISLSFGLAAFNFTTITTLPTFAGVMLIVTIPAIVIAYVAMKMPQYTKPVAIIFVIAVGAAIMAYVLFGLFGPSHYLVPPPAPPEEIQEEVATTDAIVFPISILLDSSIQGNPDYEPDEAHVPIGNVVEWTNNDEVAHTVTSKADAGATFDSSLIDAGETFQLQTEDMEAGTYEYYCIVHPWMIATLVLEEAAEVPEFEVSILPDSSIQGNPDYEPDVAQVALGDKIVWTNTDNTMHTVTSDASNGESGAFDSGIMNAGDVFVLETSEMPLGVYNYLCIVHPWMTASFEIVETVTQDTERLAEGATVEDPNSVPMEEIPDEPDVEVIEEPPVEQAETAMEEVPAEPAEVIPDTTAEEVSDATIISIPEGSAVPGCEVDDACYIPSSITVPIGTEVTWSNDDTAAHTVTSGDLKSGPIGKFDSGLFMAGNTFSHIFDEPGTYPYYCQVHPWMVGKVTVG